MRRRQVLAAAGTGAAALLAGCSVLGQSGPSFSVPDGVDVDWLYTGDPVYAPDYRDRVIDTMLGGDGWGAYRWREHGPYAFDVVESAGEAAEELRGDRTAGDFVDATDFDRAYVVALTVNHSSETELELADLYYHARGLTAVVWLAGPEARTADLTHHHLLVRATGDPPGPDPPDVRAEFLRPSPESDGG